MKEGVPKAVENDYYGSRIRDLIEAEKPAFERILEQLRTSIEAGSYSLIIGDDAGGRIPTLVLSKAIGSVYEKNGRGKPSVRFVSGYGIKNNFSKDVSDQIGRWLSESITSSEKRVLICTEFVETGMTLVPLVRSLEERGIAVDVAALSVSPNFTKNFRLKRVNIINGEGKGLPLRTEELTGIRSQSKDILPAKAEERDELWQERINHTRGIISEISNEIYSKFQNPGKEGFV